MPKRVHYAWLVVISAAIISAAGSAVVYSFGVFFKPLQAEMGWSRAVVAGVFSVFMICRGLFGMGIGWLTDRVGTRLVVAGGGLLIAVGLALTARTSASWHLYVFYGVLVGTGMSASFILPFASGTRWFEKRRGLALGIVAGGIGLGALVAPPVAQHLISGFGWRPAYNILALAALALMLAAAPFLRRNPEEMGLTAYGQSPGEALGPSKGSAARPRHNDAHAPELDLRHLVTSRPVLALSIAYLFLTLPGQTVWVHLVNNATDLGIDPLVAATFVSVSGGVSIGGPLVFGSASDRTGGKMALLIAQAMLFGALVLLLFADRAWMFYLFAAVFGFAYGGCVPQLPALLGQIYGLRSLGLLLGITGIPISLGAAAGPYIAGLLFDATGSYRMAFSLAAALVVVSFLIVLRLKVPARQAATNSQ